MIRTFVPLAAFAALVAAAPAAARERSGIPSKYTWNLADLYPSDDAWAKAKADVARRIPELKRFQGHLGDSADALASALTAASGVQRELERVLAYATRRSDEDLRVSRYQAMKQEAERLGVALASATSFVAPEILSLDPARVRGFVTSDKRLAPYRFFVEDTLRWKPHTLSAPEERIAAEAGNVTSSGEDIRSILAEADLPWPTVKLASGEEVRLDSSGYARARVSPNRDDRDRAFHDFFTANQEFVRTFGAALFAQVKGHLFTKTIRGFGSSLDSALFRDNIPTAVYRQLLADVHRSLPTLHRYLALRKRMLGVDQLRYEDLYVPLVQAVQMDFTPERAMALTLEAFAPLGKDYVETLRKGYEQRWVDFLPSTGKRSGAYSSNVYDVHPYQLLNFNGNYEDVSTLAHESGHSMHSYLSARAQPYPTADYSIFVAEVASTLNENLLLRDMLRRAKDDATRLFLLGSHLETLRTTLFRQTMFAEFELAFHERADQGETLTGEDLSAAYLKLVRQYYGHDQGVCRVADLYGVEWAFIPHFFYNFYVYQYATSLVASTAIAKAIREEEPKGQTRARDAYLGLLRAGGSDYPIELLRRAGVDMTTSRPFDAAIAEMSSTMDEMERILARQKSPR